MLDEVERQYGAAPAERASAWLIARPGVTAPIAGAFSGAQFIELIAAMRLQHDADARRTLDQTACRPDPRPACGAFNLHLSKP